MKTVKKVPDKLNGEGKPRNNENLINALYTLADAYAELAQIAMIHGDKDEVYRLVCAERAALNKARKIEAGWKL